MDEGQEMTTRDPWLEAIRAAFLGGWAARKAAVLNFEETTPEEAFAAYVKAEREAMDIAFLNLPIRLYNTLRRLNVHTVGEARPWLTDEVEHLYDVRNIGRRTVEAGQAALAAYDQG